MSVSVVIPALDEAAALPRLLDAVRGADEIVVVDGGSRDDTVAVAEAGGARVVVAPRGRGTQLAAGAAAARGDVLWFVHADTGVPDGALDVLRSCGAQWGCFVVRIGSPDPVLRWTAHVMNVRARRTGSCTGDMGIWARRDFYAAVGGWPALPAFEDLVFTDRARARVRPAVLEPALTTSARRWEQRGVGRTAAEMLALRWAWRAGVPAERLAGLYTR